MDYKVSRYGIIHDAFFLSDFFSTQYHVCKVDLILLSVHVGLGKRLQGRPTLVLVDTATRFHKVAVPVRTPKEQLQESGGSVYSPTLDIVGFF